MRGILMKAVLTYWGPNKIGQYFAANIVKCISSLLKILPNVNFTHILQGYCHSISDATIKSNVTKLCVFMNNLACFL